MTANHNDWDTFAQRSESSSSITSSSDSEIVALKAEMAKINKKLMKVLQINQQVKAVTQSCETCGCPHSYNDCLATVGQTQNQASIPQPQVVTTTEFTNYMRANDAILKNVQTNMTSLTNSNLELKNMFGQFMKMNTASSSGSGTLLSNTINNSKEDLKGITTRSEIAYTGPIIPTTSSPPKVVERKTKVTKDTVPSTNKESTKDVQPPVVQVKTRVVEPCEEYSQEILGFSVSGNPAPSTKPIVFTSPPTLTPFGDSDFFLEETDAFLAIEDEPVSPEIDDSYYYLKGDIILLEEFLNDDPLSPPFPPQELKVVKKRSPSLHLRQKPSQYIIYQNHNADC
uniref:Reverse transcriptase domain-containing protein n=1 Tax=Tanacetum cinerariifolium TaxID=118510 RepID=A0A6L2K667_TANCI|nr:reverse transcriptase domain-containing protein [Tanacetum cinerariifolium]